MKNNKLLLKKKRTVNYMLVMYVLLFISFVFLNSCTASYRIKEEGFQFVTLMVGLIFTGAFIFYIKEGERFIFYIKIKEGERFIYEERLNKKVVISFIVGTCCIIGIVGVVRLKLKINKFKPYISEYYDCYKIAVKDQDEFLYEDYFLLYKSCIIGKVVTFDINDKKIDPLFLDLPANIKANRPSEVRTIIFLNWDKTLIGYYGNLGNAYRLDCKMIIIDKNTNKIIGMKNIIGPSPSKNSISNKDYTEPPDYKELVNIISSLKHIY